jgi:hypothetical protein
MLYLLTSSSCPNPAESHLIPSTAFPDVTYPALPCLAPPCLRCSDEEIAQCCQVLGEVAKEVLK